ncbi:lipopolysaccharide biosynthesis protein [Thalassobius sp. MITS945101]|uniref:lipopolysaccharide biosynthesis protein n=1 Tax=Thalassobius sp. MITS945101 TaxID=3096994 RepID=UPI00399B4E27
MTGRTALTYLNVIASRLLGTGGNFLLLIVIGRLYGADATGLFYAVLSFGFLTSVIANMGLSRFTLRHAGVDGEGTNAQPGRADPNAIKAIGGIMALLPLLAGVAGLALGARHPDTLNLYPLGLLTGAALALLLVVADLLKTQHRPGLALIVENTTLPWLTLLAVGLVASIASTAATPAMALTLCALLLASVLAITQVGGDVRQARSKIGAQYAVLLQQKLTLATYWLNGVVVMGASRLVGLVAPLLLSAADTGVLAAAIGLVSLGGTVLQASQAYFAPRFARAFRDGAPRRLLRGLLVSCTMSTLLFLPIAALCWFYPAALLGLFGTEFVAAGTLILPILATGQALRLLAGNAEIFLSMIDRPRAELTALLLSIAVFFAVLMFASAPQSVDTLARACAAMFASRGALSMGFALWALCGLFPTNAKEAS